MKRMFNRWLAVMVAAMMIVCAMSVCLAETAPAEEAVSYTYEEFPCEYDGIALHLDRIAVEGATAEKNILLVHGLTYSSHEFDIDYQDYSLVRKLAREGYAVWRVDVAGYGRSQEVEDGFMPNSDYAAEDINAAVEAIIAETGAEKIDVLGWSWGTVTSSRFVAKYPEHVNKLVLYAPILVGLVEAEVSDPFHVNTWEHANDDFQYAADGSFDLSITDPVIIEMYASSCWHYDRTSSPNGGRRDLCVDPSNDLIDLPAISVPTLVIVGSNDPYMADWDKVNTCLEKLPEGSELEIIDGAAHAMMLEIEYHTVFQDYVTAFLAK